MVIAAHNEERVIQQKIRNTLALDYPRDKIEIIVASDGSTDHTNEIVKKYNDAGILLYEYDRLGKTGIQNETVKRAKGEIIVFSDANAMYKPDAITQMVRHFKYYNIGCVCGRLLYQEKNSKAGFTESMYWKYENLLKKSESDLSSLIGANGSIYAVRKEDYITINNNLISDLVEPLEIVKRKKKVIYEPEAISYEDASVSFQAEFKRKVRILTRSIQGLLQMKVLFNPLEYGLFALQIWFHKICRYLIPLFLIISFLSLSMLIDSNFYFSLFLIYPLFLAFAALGKVTEKIKALPFRFFSLCYYYILVNYALVLAWINVLKREKVVTWKTER